MPLNATCNVELAWELLSIVSSPAAGPAFVGRNWTFIVAVCPGFKMAGKIMPEIPNPAPLSVVASIFTGTKPDDVKTIDCVDGLSSVTLPKDTLLALTVRLGPEDSTLGLKTTPPHPAKVTQQTVDNTPASLAVQKWMVGILSVARPRVPQTFLQSPKTLSIPGLAMNKKKANFSCINFTFRSTVHRRTGTLFVPYKSKMISVLALRAELHCTSSQKKCASCKGRGVLERPLFSRMIEHAKRPGLLWRQFS